MFHSIPWLELPRLPILDKTHALAQSEVKVSCSKIKNKPNVKIQVGNEVTEWKLVGNKKKIQKRYL